MLVVIGVLASAVTAFVYVRIIVLMYFTEPAGEVTLAQPALLSVVAIAVGVVLTVLLGVFPGPLLDLAASSSVFVR